MKMLNLSLKGLWLVMLSLFIVHCGQNSEFATDAGVATVSYDSVQKTPAGENPEVLPSIPGEEIDPSGPRQTPNGEPGIDPSFPTSGNIPEIEIPTVVLPPKVDVPGLVTQTFQSTQFGQGSVQIGVQSNTDTKQVELVREYTQKLIHFNQDSGSEVTDNFTQGKVGQDVRDNFLQLEKGSLDVVLNVDSSASMREEQINLASKFQSLIGHLEGFDWQIAVNTTDPNEGCIRDVIRKGEANVEARFAAAVNAGVEGSALERGLYQSRRALEGNCWAGNWVRENSVVAVIAVSDEDECSSRGECPYAGEASADNLLNYLKSIRTLGVSARVYGLFWHPSQAQSECSTAFKPAHSYADAVDATKGTWGSICDESYESTLVQISKDMAQLLKSQFKLSNTPDQGSVQVAINGNVVNSGYTVNNDLIVFGQAPTYGSNIDVDYTVGATKLQTRFKLSEKTSSGIDSVLVNNREISKSEYQYDASTNELVYQAPLHSQIKVIYTKNMKLSSVFDLKGTVHPGTLEVYVADTLIPSNLYTVTNAGTTLEFVNAPIANSTLKVKYAQAETPVLFYPYANANSIVSIHEAGTNNLVSFSVNNIGFYIQQFDWSEGKQIVVNSKSTLGDDKYILEHLPVGNVLVKTDNEICDATKVKVNASNEVDYSDCVEDETSTVRISYKYIVSHVKDYVFDAKLLSGIQGNIDWKVFVNGIETTSYIKNGLSFLVLDDVTLGSIVSIQAK